MPRYLIERTFSAGLEIPMSADRAACLSVVDKNAEGGVTWLHSYVTEDHQKTYCISQPRSHTPGGRTQRFTSGQHHAGERRAVSPSRLACVEPLLAARREHQEGARKVITKSVTLHTPRPSLTIDEFALFSAQTTKVEAMPQGGSYDW